LEKRSRRLLRELRRCAHGSADPDRVHQLRVATRRIDAVLRLFAPLYPPRRVNQVRRKVRRLRQAARHVRDLDVLLDRLKRSFHSADPTQDLAPLVTVLRLRRDDALQVLHRAVRKRRRKRLQRRLTRLVGTANLGSAAASGSSAECVLTLLRPCMESFRAAGARDLTDITALHHFRLRAKRLRYTLELLSNALDVDVASSLQLLLKDLQEQLGQINDFASASEILDDVARASTDPVLKSQAERCVEQDRRSLQAGKAAFLQWWTAHGNARSQAALDRVLAGLSHDHPRAPSPDPRSVTES
jgi:CHAD domain-containing protein